MNKLLKTFILDFTESDMEPLHILLPTILQEMKEITIPEILETIIDLVRERRLSVYYHSLNTNGDYEPLLIFPGPREKEWVLRAKYLQIEEYPPSGGEFFFSASKDIDQKLIRSAKN